MIYALGIIFLLVIILAMIIFFKYSKLKDIENSIEMCVVSIEDMLKEELDIVNELLSLINDEKLKKDFSYDETANLITREDSLFNISFEINKYIKEQKDVKDNIKEKSKSLNQTEEALEGLKDYYNANVISYNEVFLKKYFNFVFKLLKFDTHKSFKIRKLEEYEIFKN